MTQQNQALAATDGGTDNPFLQDWTGRFGVPPFERIKPEHFRPAFARAFAEHEAEVAAIAADPAPPSFANTIEALEVSGDALARVDDVFNALSGAHTNDAILEIEREIAPLTAQHWNKILMDEALFRRVEALHRERDRLALAPEQQRVLERYHVKLVRAGAALDPASKQRLAAITERLASLGTSFSQNVLADEQSYALVLDGEADLAGLPDFLRAAAREAAEERGLSGKYARASSRSCSSHRGGICARRRSAPGSRAAMAAAKPTTRR
jgi:peptidyl-dipeptidase Dcp